MVPLRTGYWLGGALRRWGSDCLGLLPHVRAFCIPLHAHGRFGRFISVAEGLYPPEVLKLREASDKLLQSVHVKVPVTLFLRGFVGEFALLGHRIVEKFEQVNLILAN